MWNLVFESDIASGIFIIVQFDFVESIFFVNMDGGFQLAVG